MIDFDKVGWLEQRLHYRRGRAERTGKDDKMSVGRRPPETARVKLEHCDRPRNAEFGLARIYGDKIRGYDSLKIPLLKPQVDMTVKR